MQFFISWSHNFTPKILNNEISFRFSLHPTNDTVPQTHTNSPPTHQHTSRRVLFTFLFLPFVHCQKKQKQRKEKKQQKYKIWREVVDVPFLVFFIFMTFFFVFFKTCQHNFSSNLFTVLSLIKGFNPHSSVSIEMWWRWGGGGGGGRVRGWVGFMSRH